MLTRKIVPCKLKWNRLHTTFEGYRRILGAKFKHIEFSDDNFEFEASVVIPCKNRENYWGCHSISFEPKTNFPYNVIVVDDNSDDGTVDVIKNSWMTRN